MSDDKGYNGWKNYETWNMALWISNEEGSYNYSRDMATTAREAWITDGGREACGTLADQLKDWQEEAMESYEDTAALNGVAACVFTDLLHAAFSEIDWYEIASNILGEIAEVPA